MTAPFRHPEGGYVFIVTYGRSGSTLLQSILNTIPGYEIRGENYNAVLPLLRSWQLIRNSDSLERVRREAVPTTPAHPFYGAERIDPDIYGRALAAGFAQAVLQLGPQARVSGFKEIRFHARPGQFAPLLNFLRRYFPNSRFLFNTRDLDAVSRSSWWAKRDPAAVRAELGAAEALFADYAAKHPKISLQLQYDRWTQDPGSLSELYDFLGEPMDETAVRKVLDTPLEHARKLAAK